LAERKARSENGKLMFDTCLKSRTLRWSQDAHDSVHVKRPDQTQGFLRLIGGCMAKTNNAIANKDENEIVQMGNVSQ